MEQEFTLRCCRVHLFGEGTEPNATRLQFVHRRQEMRQCPTKTIELPDHQTIAAADESQCLGKTGAVTSTATGVILEQMALIDASGEQRVALQVQYLPVALAGDTHVANQHVRKTLPLRFPCTISFRQGLSHRFAGQNDRLSLI